MGPLCFSEQYGKRGIDPLKVDFGSEEDVFLKTHFVWRRGSVVNVYLHFVYFPDGLVVLN